MPGERVEIVEMDRVSAWMHNLLDHVDRETWIALVTLFGGDRASCCDEAAVLTIGAEIVGAASIAPHGETRAGLPTIVGLFVLREDRGCGFGRRLLEAAIRRCVERQLAPIQIDIMSTGAKKTIERLPEKLKAGLILHDSYVEGIGYPLDSIP